MADIKIRSRIWLRSCELQMQNFSTFFFLKRVAVIAFSFVFLMSSAGVGTTAYAYNSSSVTPESVLYDVKRGVEGYVLERKENTDERALFYLTLSDRRLAEADYLSSTDVTSFIAKAYADETIDIGDSIVEGLLVESTNLQTLALEEVQSVSDVEKVEPLLEEITIRIEQHDKVLERVEGQLSATADPTGKNSENIEARKELRKEHKEYLKNLKTELVSARAGDVQKVFLDFESKWIDLKENGDPEQVKQMKKRMEKVRSLAPMHRLQDLSKEEKKEVKQLIREGKNEEVKELLRPEMEKREKRREGNKKDFLQSGGFEKMIQKLPQGILDEDKQILRERLEKGDAGNVIKELQQRRKGELKERIERAVESGDVSDERIEKMKERAEKQFENLEKKDSSRRQFIDQEKREIIQSEEQRKERREQLQLKEKPTTEERLELREERRERIDLQDRELEGNRIELRQERAEINLQERQEMRQQEDGEIKMKRRVGDESGDQRDGSRVREMLRER